MAINSLKFIIFIAIVCILYFIFPKKIKWIVLLASSYVFYWLSSTKLTIFLIFTSISVYLAALLMEKIDKNTKATCKTIEDKKEKKKVKNKAKSRKKLLLVVAIIINLAILATLKYSKFIAGNLNNLLNTFNLSFEIPLKKFMLPLGISYYTLQAISYIVDVYRGKYEADKNLGRVALFLSFFPQMVEGPIGRYDDLANQLYEPHKFSYRNLKFGIQLMMWGYFKKLVIADRAAMLVNEVFSNYKGYVGIPIFIAVVFYTLQIYAEFSGCIDIVRGTAGIMGITMAENFKRPFFSKSIQEFWRRWHITLGTWLKDYVFYPVSFSNITLNLTNFSKKIFKKSYLSKLIPAAFALFFVWFSNGIWHGANWKYILYGLYYYVIMLLGMLLEPIGNKVVKWLKINRNTFGYSLWQILRTTGFVLIGMLIFRARRFKVAVKMFLSMFTIKNLGMIFDGRLYCIGLKSADFIVVILGMLLIFVVSLFQEKGFNIREKIEKQNIIFRWLLCYGILFAIIVLGIYGPGYNASDFIYGQF